MRAVRLMLALALALALHSARSARADNDDDDEVIATDPAPRSSLVIGPSITDVLSAAYHTAGLDHSPARSWVRRSRLAGLMPWLTVRTGRDTSWEDDGASGVGRSNVVELRATWRLDRLVFDGHELQVATIEAARRRERRRLASRVIRAYFTWKRAATAVSISTATSPLPARAEEAIAELDALTDGWFSANLTHLR